MILPLVAPAQSPEPTLRTTTSEVLLDVVVRDKHAHIIHDLRPDEVQVYENGVRQKVRHFEFVDGRTPAAESPALERAAAPQATGRESGGAEAPVTVNDLRDISVVSIVIADLDPRGRRLTLDALQKFVQTQMRPNMYIGVFSLGMAGLRAMQPYTHDGAKISAALDRAVRSALNTQLTTPGMRGPGDTSLGAADTAAGGNADPSSIPSTDPNGSLFGPAAGPTGNGSSAGAGPAAEINNMMEANWVSEMQDVYVDSQRYLTPLRALVDAQRDIPGRKVVLLFSAGLPVHGDTVELLNNVISTANRSNVSIYALDTRGTTTQSTLDYSRNLLQRAARKSMDQMLSPDKTVTPGEVILGEMAETSIHTDTRANLKELAEDTGGELLPDSLDLLEPLTRAVEDVRTHYELTYSPTDSAMDGTFRKIEVKVSRPGARVFSRSGYYALPVLNGQQVYPFEMATLKAINTRPLLHQFKFQAAALEFRPGSEQTQLVYAFETPMRGLSMVREGRWEKVHVCITALVKDDEGHIVQKLSKDIPYDLPADRTADLDKAVVSFTAPFRLSPGRYTLETAAVDRNSMKASVSRSVLVVGESSGLSMSDVAIARRLDPIRGATPLSNPLKAEGVSITPELSGTFAQDSGGRLKFYAVAYPDTPVNAPVDVEIEIWRDGRLVLRTPASVVPVDASGSAPMLATLPTDKLPAGAYEAHISFQYKGKTVTKIAPFVLDAQS